MNKKKSEDSVPEIDNISVEELQEQLNKSEAELTDCRGYKDKYWRLLAESENSRKRLTKEKHDHTKFIVQDLILDFLTPLEQFEKALGFTDNMSPEVQNWSIGFKMILDKLKGVMVDKGVVAYSVKVGDVFDPHLHEAIETEETLEYPNGTILKELAPGYKLEDRVIRPAHVKVARQSEVVEEETSEEESIEEKQKGE